MVTKYLLILFLPYVSFAFSPSVTTKSGVIIGSEESVGNRKVHRYLGMPYAKKPNGPLRFRKTVSVEPWLIPFIADHLGPGCLQNYPFSYPWVDEFPGKSEDCLYLNVWAPEGASSSSPKPVMMWIYGGGFSSGSSRLPLYKGNVLAAEGDVVVVTFNYRIGIFGFFYTNSTDAPGNMGFFDSLEALKWVNKNIEYFGGDKDNITIFGVSAGATTVAYLSVSPLAKGLFRRVIIESGSENPLITAGGDPRKKNTRLGQDVAAVLGCASNDTTIENSPTKVVQCLRTKNSSDILNAVISVVQTLETFRPIYGDEFMPKMLFQAIEDGDAHVTDVMIGNVQDEGSFILTSSQSQVFGPYGEKGTLVNKTFAKYLVVSNFMGYEKADEVADYYLRDVPEGESERARRQAYYAIGDFFFLCPVVYLAEMFSNQHHNVYYYYFNHLSKITVFAPWMGVTHFSEIPFVFGRPLDNANYTKEEKNFSRCIIKAWTNYARNGFPATTWKRFSTQDGDRPYVENLQIDENYPNYATEHFNNCRYLRQYYDFLK